MNAQSFQKLTANAIQANMQSAGSHWWDADSMRFFGTKVVGSVFNSPTSAYFVTSDFTGFDRKHRGFTVRKYDRAKNNIDTIGDVGAYATRNDAARECVSLAEEDAAGEKITFGIAEHTPMTPLDDLTQALTRAGVRNSWAQVNYLMGLARRVQKAAEDHCNKANFSPDRMYQVASEWIEKNFGIAAVVGGDPRGCTLKLVLPNGETNDMGKEGWCVPTSNEIEE